MEDRHLITQVLRGNHQAFAGLVDRYKSLVNTICLRVCKDKELAEEISQDTFLKAYQKLPSFNNQSKFSTWLYKIAYNLSLNAIKKSKVLTSSIDEVPCESNSVEVADSFYSLQQEEQKRYIHSALERLTQRYALVLSLFYLEELSLKEVAEIVSDKQANVKMQLSRARKALNTELNLMLRGELKSIL